jgi:hypothetical protein
MSKRLFFAINVMAILNFSFFCMASPLPYFSVVLNSEWRPSSANIETLCVYVNGNPVGIFANEKSIAISLNQFLKPAVNEIRMIDSARRPWNLTLVQAVTPNDSQTLLETNFASAKEFSTELNLTNINWSLPIFNRPIAKEEVSKLAILKFLQSLFLGLIDEDKSAAVNLLQQDGLMLWQAKAYGLSDDVLIKEKSDTRLNLQSIVSIIESPKEDTLKVIAGKNTVLVYSGFTSKDGRVIPFLGRLRLKNGSERVVPPLILYKKNNAWAIWQ